MAEMKNDQDKMGSNQNKGSGSDTVSAAKISAGSSVGNVGESPMPRTQSGQSGQGTQGGMSGSGMGNSGASGTGASGASGSGMGGSGMGGSGMGGSGMGTSGAGASGASSGSSAQSSTLASHTSRPMGGTSGTGAGNRDQHQGGQGGSSHHQQGQSAGGMSESARQAASRAQDVAGEAYDQASEWARDTYESATSWASDTMGRSGQSGGRSMRGLGNARQGVQQYVAQNPVMVGLVGLAAGLLLGALLPRTRREDETFGEWADEVRQQGMRYAHEMTQRGREYVDQSFSGDDDRFSRHESEFGGTTGPGPGAGPRGQGANRH